MRVDPSNAGDSPSGLTPPTFRADNMAAFDALPSALRHELRHCIAEWGAVGILAAYRADPDQDYILEELRKKDGRDLLAFTRPIERLRPERARDRRERKRVARLAARRARAIERGAGR